MIHDGHGALRIGDADVHVRPARGVGRNPQAYRKLVLAKLPWPTSRGPGGARPLPRAAGRAFHRPGRTLSRAALRIRWGVVPYQRRTTRVSADCSRSPTSAVMRPMGRSVSHSRR